jgi:hypothetical protein
MRRVLVERQGNIVPAKGQNPDIFAPAYLGSLCVYAGREIPTLLNSGWGATRLTMAN